MDYVFFSGFALVNHVLSTVNVKRPSDCVIHCLEHPSCQSINFKITGNPEHVCELNDKTEDEVALTSNSDFKYYGPSELPEVNLIIYFYTYRERAVSWRFLQFDWLREQAVSWRFLQFDWLRERAVSWRFLHAI